MRRGATRRARATVVALRPAFGSRERVAAPPRSSRSSGQQLLAPSHRRPRLARALPPLLLRRNARYTDLYNLIAEMAPYLARFPASRALFLRLDDDTDATPPLTPIAEVGEPFVNRDLAATIEALFCPAAASPDASVAPEERGGADDDLEAAILARFYRGALADEIVAASAAAVNPDTARGGLLRWAIVVCCVPTPVRWVVTSCAHWAAGGVTDV